MRYVDPDGRFVFAIPVVIGVEELGKIIVSALCVYIYVKAQDTQNKVITKTESSTKKNEKPKIYVYHHTGNEDFARQLEKSPSSVIDFSKSDKDSRFGQSFYLAADPQTASLEASYPGVIVQLELSQNANILDLTNPEVAKEYGYKEGMTRDEARYLMQSWNLTGIDAIKYPSEKNPGGYNYAILNTLILLPLD